MKRSYFLLVALFACTLAFAGDSVEDLRAQAHKVRPEEAVKLLKKAIKQDDKCIGCWVDIVEPYRKLGAYKDAANAGQKIVELATDDQARARGHFEIGWSYSLEGDAQKKASKYPDAEKELREALKLVDSPVMHLALGKVLLKEMKDPEGIDELKHALAMNLRPASKREAELLIENPRRAREPFMPEFIVTTLDGRTITNEDLVGKIVVFDFWGTWCPPCVASVGEMRSLAAHFKNEPGVVIISISTDTDGDKLRAFVEKQKMEWTQAWDHNRGVTLAFGVNSFPTYLVVDRDGVMRKVEHGGGGNQVGMVEEQVKKLLKDSKRETKVASAQ